MSDSSFDNVQWDILPALAGPVSWSPKMAFDMAMGACDAELQERYELESDEYLRIVQHPAFRQEVNEYIQDVRKNGVTFKAKARLQAEEYLAVVDSIVMNPLINPTTRLDAVKSMVKWGELEPVAASAASSGHAQPAFNIQINLNG